MLTYKDRLKLLRETKIAHTLAKKKQNGYVDMDDYGTVPIPEGYHVDPWYNSSNGSFYGNDGMSENFCRVIDAHPAYVDPLEMLCGRWRDMLVNYRGDTHYLPDWIKKDRKLKNFENEINAQFSKRWDEERFPYDHLKPEQKKYNIQTGIDSDAHLACDYSIGFELGFGGFLAKIEKYRKINPDKADFYNAEEKCVKAIIRFIDRHIEEIKRLIKTENRPEILESLKEMLEVNKNIRLAPPKTFHEVCQWCVYFNCAARIYTRDGAGFQLDGLLYPYYENDVKNGILDDEKAVFLLANLILNDSKYYQVSGVDENDNDMTNHLSYLILEACDAINISANVTVRYHENCDREFFKKAVYYLIKNKNGWPRFCSDKNLAEGYMRNDGVTKKIARSRIAVGCNWMCVPGIEFPMNDTVKINIAKCFEHAMNDMKSEECRSTDRLFELFGYHVKKAVEVTAAGINLHIDHQAEVTPELIMNLMMKNTIEKGEDISRVAELYTVGIDGIGLAVVADSFGALATRVENEKVLSWDEVYENLENNFDGVQGERVRLILNSSPKYCGGDTVSDKWAQKIRDCFVSTMRAQEMPEGRQLIPGWFSWARTIEYGAAVGATPNGRRNGEPVSHGANPNYGFRKDGAPTAQSTGIALVQCGWGNTAPLQIEFDPLISLQEGALERIIELIEGHFKLGGTLININVLDGDKLLEANKDPEKYPDLVVRVTGFTAYFVSLSPEFRQLVVDRFLKGI